MITACDVADQRVVLGQIQGIGLRLFNPKSRQWSLNRASLAVPTMGVPMIGGFLDLRVDAAQQALVAGARRDPRPAQAGRIKQASPSSWAERPCWAARPIALRS